MPSAIEDEELDYAATTPTMDGLVTRRTEGVTTAALASRLLKVAEAMAGSRLYPYQRRFAYRVLTCILERESEELSALFSRQSGKSQVLSALCASCMIILPLLARQFPEDDRFRYIDPKSETVRSYENGFWIGIFAPKKEQAGIIFNRVRGFFRSETAQAILGELGLSFESNNGDTIRLNNGSFIKCSTASDQANIEGYTLHLGILEESQDIGDEKVNKSIRPMMASTGGTIVKIGTANARKSHFYNTIRRNERRHLQGGPQNHFFADWEEAAKYNTAYEQFVRKEMLRLGERSDEFLMAYCCRFMLQRGLAVTEKRFKSRTVVSGTFSDILPGPRKGMHYCAGIDFGKMHDSTIVTVGEVNWDNPRQVLEGYDSDEGAFTVELFGKHVCDWLELQGDDYEAQFVEIRKFLAKWNVERIALDYTGVGVALGDRVRAQFEGADVEFVAFSSQSKDQLARQFLADLETGMITWPGGEVCQERTEWKDFRLQLLDLEKEYRQGGLLTLHHPDVRGAKDDYPDSLMLFIHAACTRPFGGEVEETDENIYRR